MLRSSLWCIISGPTNRPNNRPFIPRPGRPLIRPFRPGQVIDDKPSKSDSETPDLPPGIEPDTGTFINISPSSRVPNTGIIRPTSFVRPSRVRPTIRPSKIDTPTIVTKDNFKTDRPNFFTPRSRTTTDKSTTSTGKDGEEDEDKTPNYKSAGSPFISKRPPFGKNDLYDKEAKRNEQLSNSIDGAIVEPIGTRTTAPDSDPVTKCQNTCGLNEICQIKSDEILCNCRPGFGRRSPGASCESESASGFPIWKVFLTSSFLHFCRIEVLRDGGLDQVRERGHHRREDEPRGVRGSRGRHAETTDSGS